MPSPFPGMDPYLEGAAWESFHAQFIGELGRQLAPRLRPKYMARVERRFSRDTTDQPDELTVSMTDVRPDVGVMQRDVSARMTGTGIAVSTPPLQLETVIPEHVPQWSLRISDVAERRLVTAIEMLSPTNKRGDGRTEYLARRDKFLSSSTHLIELDLLRKGTRVPMRGQLPPMPYFAFVSRAERRPLTGIWPIKLRDFLPPIPVPLLDGDDDVVLDLQSALNSMYDAFGYDLELNYSQPPDIPLLPDDSEWAQQLLAKAGHIWGNE